ncbi:MAG: iron-siderophore ABC transporter substrate-binding protein [Chloroflexota bacterium]
MHNSKQRFTVSAVVFLLLLTACGAGFANSPPATVEGESRTIEHAMGITEVPVDPQRVVVLDTGELDSALALGVKPVGAVAIFADGGLPDYLEGQTDGIEVVGTISEPNLEAIVALEPDLILSNSERHRSIYRQLNQIAPTVFAETVGVVWKENLLLYADALNKTAEAETLFEAYDARTASIRDGFGDTLPEVSIVRFLPGQVRVYLKGSFSGTVLEDIGLPRPENQDSDDFALYLQDLESIPQMDGDLMFMTTYGLEEDTDKPTFLGSPLWQQLDVAQSGEIYEVDDSYWMLGIGIIAANQILDDFEAILLDSN